MIELEPLGMHWLDVEAESGDLCLHGGVRVTVHGEVVIDTGPDDYALSTGALHLLRTLDTDHTADHKISDHLVPHCGHFMVVDEESGTVINLGCAAGVDWWVRRASGDVVLTFDEVDVRVPVNEWIRAMCAFSDTVESFYDAGAEKEPYDELSKAWYPLFRAEWRQLRERASEELRGLGQPEGT